jgi:hypothetical protein
MYGSTGMGRLSVYYTGSTGLINRVFRRVGNQGNAWKRVAVEIPPTNRLQVNYYINMITSSSSSSSSMYII